MSLPDFPGMAIAESLADALQAEQPEQPAQPAQPGNPEPMEQQQEFPEGLRRWGRGRWRNDFTYYTFQDYMGFVTKMGKTEDDRGNKGTFAIALNLWNRSKDKKEDERETAVFVDKVKAQLESLQHIPIETLANGAEGVVFQLVQSEEPKHAGAAGSTLRSRKCCKLDVWGGIGPESVFGVEVVKQSPTLQVRLRSFTGQYLESRGGVLGFFGRAVDEAQDGGDGIQVIEVLPRDAPVPVAILATKGGRLVGTFAPRRINSFDQVAVAGGPLPAPGMQARLVAAAQQAAEAEPTLMGRRRHLQDSKQIFYSFPEMVLHFQRLYKLQEAAALELARAIWLHACTPEPEPAWAVVADATLIEDVEM